MAASNTAIGKGGTNQTFKGRRQNFKKQKIESKNLVLRRHFIRKKKKKKKKKKKTKKIKKKVF
jgi:IS1 family transposase